MLVGPLKILESIIVLLIFYRRLLKSYQVYRVALYGYEKKFYPKFMVKKKKQPKRSLLRISLISRFLSPKTNTGFASFQPNAGDIKNVATRKFPTPAFERKFTPLFSTYLLSQLQN